MTDQPIRSVSIRLSRREEEILGTVLESYWTTGEPVGSRTISEARADGLSSASIRTVLAELESKGLLFQPHTSAGRIPTAAAVRFYLQQLEPVAALSSLEAVELEKALQVAGDEQEMLAHASHFLSAISRQVGVIALTPRPESGLRDLRFFRLADSRVLALMTGVDGTIFERVSRVPEDYTQSELNDAAEYFNRSFRGLSLPRIRHELTRRIEEERAAYDRLLKRVVVLYHCGLLNVQPQGRVFLEGASNLATWLHAGEALAWFLRALNEKELLLQLLTGMAEREVAVGREGAVRVQVGLEAEALNECALVRAQYRTRDQGQGTIAILGSTCMPYQRAVAAVALVRELLSRVGKGN